MERNGLVHVLKPLVVTAIGLGLLLPTAIAGESETDHASAIDAFVGQFVDFAMFDGNILVDVAGKVVYERSFGLANYELKVAHRSQTRFRVASVSKFFTDVALARWIDRGEFTLETPISRFLPDFPRGQDITIQHLLDHSSGIPHTNGQPWGDGKTSMPLEEIIERLAALPLDFEPGTDSGYSNGGYAVAARVLEVVGGGTYGEVMRSTVFDPLGLDGTGHIADVRTPVAGMATGYEPGRLPGERRHSRFYAVEMRPGGGSLYSTAPDLLRLARAVFREGFVSPSSRKAVLGVDRAEHEAEGRSPGFVSKLYHDADRDVIVVSTANSYAVPADWGRAIADLAMTGQTSDPWPDLVAGVPTVAPDDPRLGRYRSSYTSREQVFERDERGTMILADPSGDSITAMVPLSDGAFLQPLYFQRCVQSAGTRAISCRILSGNPRYVTELVPVSE